MVVRVIFRIKVAQKIVYCLGSSARMQAALVQHFVQPIDMYRSRDANACVGVGGRLPHQNQNLSPSLHSSAAGASLYNHQSRHY